MKPTLLALTLLGCLLASPLAAADKPEKEKGWNEGAEFVLDQDSEDDNGDGYRDPDSFYSQNPYRPAPKEKE